MHKHNISHAKFLVFKYIHMCCVRFFNRLYSEYQQLLEVKRLQLKANDPEYDEALLEQVKMY